ncbi:MAG: outer membrane protein assembly factor BamE [Methylophaga sp.]|nr:outer membrane protein assembly factor BamE [Methylophaga sp.]
MKSLIIYSLSLLTIFLSACSTDKIPGVYRIDIQQGNEVSQEMISRLEPGMTKNQVAFVMGSPLLINTFQPNRWDYIYSFQPGNGPRQQQRITLYFDNDERLEYIQGDVRVVERSEMPEFDTAGANVVVPLQEHRTGFFRGLMGIVGLGRDDEQIIDRRDESSTHEIVEDTQLEDRLDQLPDEIQP